MNSPGDKLTIPTLTDVACPGETLRARGLWLPLQSVNTASEATSDWRERLPSSLQDKADGLLEETRYRAHKALDAALVFSDGPDIDPRR